jgi:hypothetical protein
VTITVPEAKLIRNDNSSGVFSAVQNSENASNVQRNDAVPLLTTGVLVIETEEKAFELLASLELGVISSESDNRSHF